MKFIFLNHSEDGRGQWKWEDFNIELWNECAPEKIIRGAKAICLCMI